MAGKAAKGKSAAAGAGSAGEADAFMAALEHPKKAEIEALRKLIRAADKRIQEGVKWNAPSFFIEDHFATLKLFPPDKVQVVLHTGAKAKSNSATMKVDDPAKLLKWAAKDRCVATFANLKDIEAGKAAFTAILKQWIAQL